MNTRLTRILLVELIVIATGVIFYFAGSLVAQFANVALIVALAILVTYALLPAVNFLDRSKFIPRWLAVLIVYITMFAALAGIVAAISKPVTNQVKQLASEYPKYVDQVTDAVPNTQRELDKRNIKIDLQQKATDFSKDLEEAAGSLVSKTGSIIASIFGTLSTAVLVLFVTLYFLVSGRKIVESLIKSVPVKRHRMLKRLAQNYDRILGSYVRGQLLIAAIVGVAVMTFCAIVGLPYWALLGLLSGAFSTIPTVGTAISMLGPVAVAAFVNPVLIPVFVVFFIVLNEISDKVLQPRIVGKAVDLHPLLVLFGFLIGIQVAGVAGALLATPLMALVKVTVNTLRKTGYAQS